MFSLIKPQLEANYKRFLNGKKGADFGKLGGRPKTPKKPLDNPKLTPNVNVNVNDNVNVNANANVNVNVKDSIEKRESKFLAPSLLEVQQIFTKKLGDTKTANLEAEIFYNFYGSKNWYVGKSKMKNYKLAAAGWISRKKLENNEKPNKQERAKQLQATADRQFGVSL